MSINEPTKPLVPGCGLDSAPSLSSFLEESILGISFVGDSGTTYNVTSLDNGPQLQDLRLHSGYECRPLNKAEIQQMSSRVRAFFDAR